jgi:hypothetical protein
MFNWHLADICLTSGRLVPNIWSTSGQLPSYWLSSEFRPMVILFHLTFIALPFNVCCRFVLCLVLFYPTIIPFRPTIVSIYFMFIVVPFNICCHFVGRPSPFYLTSVPVLSDVCPHSIWCLSPFVYLIPSMHRHPSIDVHSPFIPVDGPYSLNYTLC